MQTFKYFVSLFQRQEMEHENLLTMKLHLFFEWTILHHQMELQFSPQKN